MAMRKRHGRLASSMGAEMATLRRRRVDRREALTAEALEWLLGADEDFYFFELPARLEAVWQGHKEWVLAEHVKKSPGTRPRRWWQREATEPRRRLGGKGTLSSDVIGVLPTWHFGIPTCWHELDPDDPPTFESEAAYLERLGLFLPGERARLTKHDFEPEIVAAALDHR